MMQEGVMMIITNPPPDARNHNYYRVLTISALAGQGDDVMDGAASESTSGRLHAEAAVSPRKEAQLTLEQYKEIYDRLIKIFSDRPRDDWKKLIIFSKQWGQHQQGVFDRLKEQADKEQDVDKKMALRKMYRSLQGVSLGEEENILRKPLQCLVAMPSLPPTLLSHTSLPPFT
jgi:hypothetical protein